MPDIAIVLILIGVCHRRCRLRHGSDRGLSTTTARAHPPGPAWCGQPQGVSHAQSLRRIVLWLIRPALKQHQRETLVSVTFNLSDPTVGPRSFRRNPSGPDGLPPQTQADRGVMP